MIFNLIKDILVLTLLFAAFYASMFAPLYFESVTEMVIRLF